MGLFSRSKKKDAPIERENPLRAGRPPPPRPNAPPPPGKKVNTAGHPPPPRPPPGGASDNASVSSSASKRIQSGRPPPPRPGRGPPPRQLPAEHLFELQETKKKVTELMADNVEVKKKLAEATEKLELYEKSGETSRSNLLEKEVASLHTELQAARIERMTLQQLKRVDLKLKN